MSDVCGFGLGWDWYHAGMPVKHPGSSMLSLPLLVPLEFYVSLCPATDIAPGMEMRRQVDPGSGSLTWVGRVCNQIRSLCVLKSGRDVLYMPTCHNYGVQQKTNGLAIRPCRWCRGTVGGQDAATGGFTTCTTGDLPSCSAEFKAVSTSCCWLPGRFCLLLYVQLQVCERCICSQTGRCVCFLI